MKKPLLKVSVAEFLTQENPTGRRSALAPFADDVERLIEHGYSLNQVTNWLGQNGVTITPSAISQFRARRDQRVDSVARSSNGRRVPSSHLDVDDGGQTSTTEKRQALGVKPEKVVEGLRQATQKLREADRGLDLSAYKPPD